MPTATEPTCNLTLSRDEWAVLVALLDNVRTPLGAKVRQAIRGELDKHADVARVGIERECEKWCDVINAVTPHAFKRGGAYGRVWDAMTRQVADARFRTQR